jgi:hypothetical protein
MAEVDDAVFEQMQRGMALLQTLASDPKSKRDFERVVKKIRPDVQTTDDVAEEIAAPYVAQIGELSGQMKAFLTAQEERDAKATENQQIAAMNEAFGRLRSQGLQEEGEEAVKKLMVDRNIADPEAAFALFERQNPKPAPGAASWEPDSWNFRERAVDTDIDGLYSDPDLWGDKMVGKVLSEMRQVA